MHLSHGTLFSRKLSLNLLGHLFSHFLYKNSLFSFRLYIPNLLVCNPSGQLIVDVIIKLSPIFAFASKFFQSLHSSNFLVSLLLSVTCSVPLMSSLFLSQVYFAIPHQSWILWSISAKLTASSISLPFPYLQSLPSIWGLSLRLDTLPIPKSSSPTSPSNYRPISLFSLTSKLLERHVHNFLYNYCIANNLLSCSQCGFCPAFSTEYVVLHSWSTLDSHRSVISVLFNKKKSL